MTHRRPIPARPTVCPTARRRSARAAAVAGAWLLAAGAALAAPVSFVGEDLGAGSAAAMPNAQAARTSFLAQLQTSATDSLENRPADSPVSNLLFSGLGVIGSLSTPTLVRTTPSGGAFAADGSKYLATTGTRRISFSKPVAGFGLFVTDAGDHDNDPATVTIGGQPLDAGQLAARPYGGLVDEVLQIWTERAGGTLELLYGGGSLPAPSGSALFVGLIDAAQPFANIILVNGAAGLDSAWNDGVGLDRFTVGTAAPTSGGTVPEPAGPALLALAAAAGVTRRTRLLRPACGRP